MNTRDLKLQLKIERARRDKLQEDHDVLKAYFDEFKRTDFPGRFITDEYRINEKRLKQTKKQLRKVDAKVKRDEKEINRRAKGKA